MTIPKCKITREERAVFRELTRLGEQGKEYGVIVCLDKQCEFLVGDSHHIDIQRILSERWGADTDNIRDKLEGARLYHNHPVKGKAILSPMDVVSSTMGGFEICAVSPKGDRMCANPKFYTSREEAQHLLAMYDMGMYICYSMNNKSKERQKCAADLFKDKFDVCVGKLH
jgi:hypothetical protein